MDDCIMNEEKPEIKYFNESIIAKKNRSRARSAINGKKETPFLSDESGLVSSKLDYDIMCSTFFFQFTHLIFSLFLDQQKISCSCNLV